MSKLGITLNLLNNNNSLSPPFSSPLGSYYAEELRMTSHPFIIPPFDKVRSTVDIIKLINNATILKTIGKGTSSEGQVVEFENGNKYILRKTKVENKKVRDNLLNEQLIYTILEKDKNYKKYISNLLYADVPLIHHKSDAYNNAYFVFEYKDGETLDTFIENNRDKISFSDIMILTTNIYKALQFISEKGIVHRDIKPENIYLDKTNHNQPLLFDFDISCRKGIDCKASEFTGTRKYMSEGSKRIANKNSPLAFSSYEYTHYYDVYSLATLLEQDLIKVIRPEDKQKLVQYAQLLKDQFKMYGGNRMRKNYTRKAGGQRIGVLNPWWGGKRRTGGKSKADGKKRTGKRRTIKGGACGCQVLPKLPTALGGYRPTKRNLKYLKMWKRGESIGFTMKSSLKAKGLIPRSNGTKRVSPKYRK
jgi:serine/threonine protein kinase